MPEPCPVCGNPSNAGSPMFRGRKEVTCESCGQFQICDTGEATLKRLALMSDVRYWRKLPSGSGRRGPVSRRGDA
jgi:hypothetical protein